MAELQKVARDEKVSFGMATLHFVGKFGSQVYYQTLWYSYYYTYIDGTFLHCCYAQNQKVTQGGFEPATLRTRN